MLYSQNIEILSRVIIDDAYREAEVIIVKAKKESETIRANCLKESNDLKNRNLTLLSKMNISGSRGKIISLAEFAARSEIFKRKEEILTDILQQVQQEFFTLPEHENYTDILKKLILQALKHLEQDGNAFLCRVNARDRVLLTLELLHEMGVRLGKGLSLDQCIADIAGGIILFRDDLRVRYDNSLEAIYERHKQQMRCMAAQCIFGNE